MRLPFNLVYDIWKGEKIASHVDNINGLLQKHHDLHRDEDIAICFSSFEDELVRTAGCNHERLDVLKNTYNARMYSIIGNASRYSLEEIQMLTDEFSGLIGALIQQHKQSHVCNHFGGIAILELRAH